EAIARVPSSNYKLVLAGPLDDPDYGNYLHKLTKEYNCSDRVELRFGFHPRDEIARLVNGSLACAYAPIDEDSLGYVTMEAFAAGKCVITTADAGGVLEIVQDGATGYVTDPDPRSLAESFTRIARNKEAAIEMGRAAKALLAAKGLSWPGTIARLLSE